jgi:hypothetical protein
MASITTTPTTAQGRYNNGKPFEVPPPPVQAFAVLYETPAGLALIEVEARGQGEAIDRAFRLNAIDEDAVTNARVFNVAGLFRTVDDVLAGKELQS